MACEAAGEEKAEIGSSMEEAKEEIASGLRSRVSRVSPGPEILVEVSVEVGVVGGSGEAAGAAGAAGGGRLGKAAGGGARAWRVWTRVPPAALQAVATRPVPSGDAAGCAAGAGAGCWPADCAASSAADSTSSDKQYSSKHSSNGAAGGAGAAGAVGGAGAGGWDPKEEGTAAVGGTGAVGAKGPVPTGCAAGAGAGCWRADCAASSAAASTSSERQSGSGTLGGMGAMETVLESSEAARDRREEPRGAACPSQGGRPPVALRPAALAAVRSSVGGQVLAVVEGEEPG